MIHADGFHIERGLLSPDSLRKIADDLDESPRMKAVAGASLHAKSPYLRAFDRAMNLWTSVPSIESLIHSPVLVSLATRLLKTDSLRLSHDQSLYKLPNGDATPIHADQYHWPVSSEKTLTAWIPLQSTDHMMGSLKFYRGSHLLSDEQRAEVCESEDKDIEQYFRDGPFPLCEPEFEIGDVSFHLGWTFHCAGANQTSRTRRVLTIIYFEDGIRLKQTRPELHEGMLQFWCPGRSFGDLVDSPNNPIVRL